MIGKITLVKCKLFYYYIIFTRCNTKATKNQVEYCQMVDNADTYSYHPEYFQVNCFSLLIISDNGICKSLTTFSVTFGISIKP